MGDNMLDFRLLTFIELCKTMNYTRTAEKLHLTQPAVTQHIKYLEHLYECKLFMYTGKTLHITKQGKILKELTEKIQADSSKIKRIISESFAESESLNFGATLTIGEFTMPPIISEYMNNYKTAQIIMLVENTEMLLEMLNNGKIDFAFIEGHFNKNDYGYELFSNENFIAVCSKDHRLANKTVDILDLLCERIIVREKGSGTRDIFEKVLSEKNMSINNFLYFTEIGNLNVIKGLVSQGLGITFIYEEAAKEDILKGRLCKIDIKNFNVVREFNFVYLKDSIFKEKYLNFFGFCKCHKI